MTKESPNMCEACPSCQTTLIDQQHLAFQLQEARAAAEAATEAKSVFLANLSHEIRTPLNGMIAVAQLLMRTTLSPEQRELASTLEESGSALLSILGDVLDFSSIGINDVDINVQPVWLREVIEGCTEAAAPTAKRKDVHLSYRLSPEFSQRQIAIDQVRLRQVLLFLVNNAVKFNKDCGEVEIIAASVVGDADGDSLSLSVRDTGIGMDKEAIDSLFATGFHQGESALNRRHGGAGLGLAIASRLVRLMSGSIQVESQPGCGSTFSFLLPLTWVKKDPPCPISTINTTNNNDATKPCIRTDPDTPSMASHRGIASHQYLSFTTTEASSSLAPSHSGSLADIHGASSTANLSTYSVDSNSDNSPVVNTGKDGSLDLLPSSRRASADGGVGGCALGLPPLPLQYRPAPPASADFRSSSFFTATGSIGATTATNGLVPAAVEVETTTSTPPPEVDSPKGSSSTRDSSPSSSPSLNPSGLINLSGRTIFIDVPHRPTAAQLEDSCQLEGMVAVVATAAETEGGDSIEHDVSNISTADICITTPVRAFHVLRNGWKGRPIVVIGSRDEVPLVLQPAVVMVSSPLQHSRLLGSLKKALAPNIAALDTPLHADPSMLLQHAGSSGAGGVGGALRGPSRHSLDNSAFDRRHILPLSSAALRQRDGNQDYVAAAPSATGGWVPQLSSVRSDSPASPRSKEQQESDSEHSEEEGGHGQGGQRKASSADAFETTSASTLQNTQPADREKPFSILVAEDNLINVRVVLRVLHHVLPAAEVDVVNNGIEVLQATSLKRYDLLLLDIHMPEMDGLEAAEKLKQMVPPDRLPTIVALSADTMESARARCAAVGIVDFVSKPFRIEDVERVVAIAKERKTVI